MNGLEGFRFNQLPAEIRCMIWIGTLSQPRIVSYHNHTLPLALQVNRESRHEALKVLALLFEPKEKYGAYKLRSRQLLGHEHQAIYPTYVNPYIDLFDISVGKGGVPQEPNRLILQHADIHKVKAVFVYFDSNISQWFACMPKKISNLQVFSQPVRADYNEKCISGLIPIFWEGWN